MYQDTAKLWLNPISPWHSGDLSDMLIHCSFCVTSIRLKYLFFVLHCIQIRCIKYDSFISFIHYILISNSQNAVEYRMTVKVCKESNSDAASLL